MRDASGTNAVVDVTDTGPGVAPEDRERIFDRFYRATAGNGARSMTTGAGLGLAIARWVTRAHGGDTVLRESSERGSTFRISIPVPPSA
jgi:two-component system OmpR family sensor kinase